MRAVCTFFAAALALSGCNGVRDPTGELRECGNSPVHPGAANGVHVLVRVRDAMSTEFDPEAMCIAADGMRLVPLAPKARFAKGVDVDFAVTLDPRRSHRIQLVGQFESTRYRGYRFTVVSSDMLDDAALRAGVIRVHFVERGGPSAPLVRRPTIVWMAGDTTTQ